MLKRIGLFSLFVFFVIASFATDTTKINIKELKDTEKPQNKTGIPHQISLNVQVISQFNIDKPPLMPPDKLKAPSFKELDLSGEVLQPPAYLELTPVKPLKNSSFISCGEPDDVADYSSMVSDYLNGDYKGVEKNFERLLKYPYSPYLPMGYYVMGMTRLKENNESSARDMFYNSCKYTSMYQQSACEGYYALSLKLNQTPTFINSPTYHKKLWETVFAIKNGGRYSTVNCAEFVFKNYCSYINDFIQGIIIPGYYQNSLFFRSGIINYFSQKYDIARQIFETVYTNYSLPYDFRYKALYYLALIDLKEKKYDKALEKAVMIENLYPGSDLALNLYALIGEENPKGAAVASILSDNKYSILTKLAAVQAYNSGDYAYAKLLFLKIKDYKDAVYAAIKARDYKDAINILQMMPDHDEFYYKWLAESYYYTDNLIALRDLLRSPGFKAHKELYNYYKGWYYFKMGDYQKALTYFSSRYYKAIVYFNMGDYKDVIRLLENPSTYDERILLAKAYLSIDEPAKVREVLKPTTDEAKYLYGLSYFIQNDYQNAIRYFKEVASSKDFGAKALLKLGDAYYNMGDINKAVYYYQKVVENYPNSKEAMEASYDIISSRIKNPSKNLEVAIKQFIQRYKDNPLSEDLKYQLANIYIKQGKKDEAYNLLSTIVGGPRYRAMLKMAMLEPDPHKKEELLLSVIDNAQGQTREKAKELLADLYLKEGHINKAAAIYSTGDEKDLIHAYEIYISNHMLNKAKEILSRLISQYQDDKVRALALEAFNTFKDPELLKFASNSQDPSIKAKAFYELGNYYLSHGDKNKALKEYVSVVLLTPNQEDIYKDSIFKATKILISLHAYEDASCLLDKLNMNSLSNQELYRVKSLKRRLPACKNKNLLNTGG